MRPIPQIRHAAAEYRGFFNKVSPVQEKILAALSKPVGAWTLAEAPLGVVPEAIGREFGVPCRIDVAALEDFGLDAATPVTLNLSGVSLRSTLNRLLGPIDLAFIVTDEALLITTRERAEEHLVVGHYPLPTNVPPRELVDLIQSCIAADSWDTVGGPGAIRSLTAVNLLVVSQLLDVHEELAEFLARLDADPGRVGDGSTAEVPVRIHPLRDPARAAEWEAAVVSMCNTVLGPAGDPGAVVARLGDGVVVRSTNRAFQAYAAQLMRAFDGVEVTTAEVFDPFARRSLGGMAMAGTGGGGGGGGLCWVAREVYGIEDGRWLLFRRWMFEQAPGWVQSRYVRHGEAVAAWLHGRPVAKTLLRWMMNAAIAH